MPASPSPRAAASAQPNVAQTCIPLGGSLLTTCKQEFAFVNQPNEYPLTSTTAPDDAKVQSVVGSIPAGLPSAPAAPLPKSLTLLDAGARGPSPSRCRLLVPRALLWAWPAVSGPPLKQPRNLFAAGSASAQPNAAQTCIPLGGPLLTDCKQEIAFLNQPNEYPLTSTTAPDDAKVQSVVSSIPAGLPSAACCTAVQKFDSAGCSCEASLSQSLQAVGVSSTPEGLAGGKCRACRLQFGDGGTG
ncbi:hypothetical protein ACK3TF_002817 [Chlorella vulgaris]